MTSTPGGGAEPPNHINFRMAKANQNMKTMKIKSAARAYGDGVGWWKRVSAVYDDVEASNDDRGEVFSSPVGLSDVGSLWYLAEDISSALGIS